MKEDWRKLNSERLWMKSESASERQLSQKERMRLLQELNAIESGLNAIEQEKSDSKLKRLKLALVVWFGWLHSIQSRLHFNHKLIEAGLIERTRQPTQTNQSTNQFLFSCHVWRSRDLSWICFCLMNCIHCAKTFCNSFKPNSTSNNSASIKLLLPDCFTPLHPLAIRSWRSNVYNYCYNISRSHPSRYIN